MTSAAPIRLRDATPADGVDRLVRALKPAIAAALEREILLGRSPAEVASDFAIAVGRAIADVAGVVYPADSLIAGTKALANAAHREASRGARRARTGRAA